VRKAVRIEKKFRSRIFFLGGIWGDVQVMFKELAVGIDVVVRSKYGIELIKSF
jgi:hypothetical protein